MQLLERWFEKRFQVMLERWKTFNREWYMKDVFSTTTTTTPQPFYGPFSGTIRVSRCQKRISGLYGAREN